MVGIRIDALPTTVLPSSEHEFPAMKDGLSVRLTVAQVVQVAVSMGLIAEDDLGAAAFLGVGTTVDTVAAGNDARIVGALQRGGGEMTGPLALAADAETAMQAVSKQQMEGHSLGVGQTWQDVSASRSEGTSYQNTTGRPIQVGLCADGASSVQTFQVSDDGVTFNEILRVNTAQTLIVFAVVKPGQYYKLARVSGSTTNIRAWSELR